MGATLFSSGESLHYIGQVPPTPLRDDEVPALREPLVSLLNRALRYGQLVGYKQEQNGKIIQHIFPKKANEQQQISGSSKVQLALHTEAAFHPYKPDYVVLMCLRGDKEAKTTYANVEDIIKHLDQATIEALSKKEFVTSVDDSFRANGEPDEEIVLAILEEEDGGWRITYDEALMRGTTPEAQAALEKLSEAISSSVKSVVLESGDILIIDNKTTVHGRTPFTPRYDGSDRWLIRALLRKELPPDEHRDGPVITYEFGS